MLVIDSATLHPDCRRHPEADVAAAYQLVVIVDPVLIPPRVCEVLKMRPQRSDRHNAERESRLSNVRNWNATFNA